MTFFGADRKVLETGRELGRGGEGRVLDLTNQPGMVLKQYFEPLTDNQIAKLWRMIDIRNEAVCGYAAWPEELVEDPDGHTVGFIMKKLSGYVPLHHLFSPMDRKKMFPDKGYNFLAHVARNLAVAFQHMHESGLVIGDVNEGNILVNAIGLVSFIDCDSFQIPHEGGSGYYYCEVGVPRFTPPELLKKGTFEQVVRTQNTDDFSLAVLIFQLLFLGRHPFAGKSHSPGEMDEETAIRTGAFAYSLRKKRQRLSPPPDSFPINGLPDELVDLFHQAFEEKVRPAAGQWAAALNALLQDMQTCSLTRLHSYPSGMEECPWCRFRKERGILYFLDDSYLQANRDLGDLDQFVQGFRIDPLEIREISAALLTPSVHPMPVNGHFVRMRNATALMVVLGIAFSLVMFLISPILTVFWLLVTLTIYSRLSWKKQLLQQETILQTEAKKEKERLQQALNQYHDPADLQSYHKNLEALEQSVSAFRNLPQTGEQKRRDMEDRLYNEQLRLYLACFKLEHHAIPAIGPNKKEVLMKNGIENAADVYRIGSIKIPGIGPKNKQLLIDWQRQLATGFLYMPDSGRVAEELRQTETEMLKLRGGLERQIRRQHQDVTYQRTHLVHKADRWQGVIAEQARKAGNAEAAYQEFRKMCRFNLPFLITRPKARQNRP